MDTRQVGPLLNVLLCHVAAGLPRPLTVFCTFQDNEAVTKVTVAKFLAA